MLRFHYRTEPLCCSCGLFHRRMNRLARENDWHKEAVRNWNGVFETAREEPQPEPKQAKVRLGSAQGRVGLGMLCRSGGVASPDRRHCPNLGC